MPRDPLAHPVRGDRLFDPDADYGDVEVTRVTPNGIRTLTDGNFDRLWPWSAWPPPGFSAVTAAEDPCPLHTANKHVGKCADCMDGTKRCLACSRRIVA